MLLKVYFLKLKTVLLNEDIFLLKQNTFTKLYIKSELQYLKKLVFRLARVNVKVNIG